MRGSEAHDPAAQDAPEALIEPTYPPNVVPLRPRRVADPAATPEVVPVSADPGSKQRKPTAGAAPVHLPQWPLTLVLAAMALGITVVMVDSLRRGALVMAAAMALSFLLRMVLTDRDAGMLKVRSRTVDLIVLGGFAAALLVLGFWVPVPR